MEVIFQFFILYTCSNYGQCIPVETNMATMTLTECSAVREAANEQLDKYYGHYICGPYIWDIEERQ